MLREVIELSGTLSQEIEARLGNMKDSLNLKGKILAVNQTLKNCQTQAAQQAADNPRSALTANFAFSNTLKEVDETIQQISY